MPGGASARALIERIPVQMGTAASDGTPFQGRLQLIDNQVDAKSGTVRVRAVFDNNDGALMPGQFARVRMGQARRPTRRCWSTSARSAPTRTRSSCWSSAPTTRPNTARSRWARRSTACAWSPSGLKAGRAHRRQRPAARAPRRAGGAAGRGDGRQGRAAGAARPSASRTRNPEPACQRNHHESFQVLHRPADLRRRAVAADLPRRPDRAARAADLGIPRGGAALGGGARPVPGRQPEGDRRDGGHAAGGSDQRRRGHALHGQPGDHRRRDDADRHLQARHRPRQGAAAGAEPRRRRPSRACPRKCAGSA